mmetsp:Transcript_21607/g.38581  ORF Transcript_21607/g.38581 Transcript_21607/m.38581 type:complete len:203 (-) Transcript_21607:1271-1879(-)
MTTGSCDCIGSSEGAGFSSWLCTPSLELWRSVAVVIVGLLLSSLLRLPLTAVATTAEEDEAAVKENTGPHRTYSVSSGGIVIRPRSRALSSAGTKPVREARVCKSRSLAALMAFLRSTHFSTDSGSKGDSIKRLFPRCAMVALTSWRRRPHSILTPPAFLKSLLFKKPISTKWSTAARSFLSSSWKGRSTLNRSSLLSPCLR